jgi:hypothetical protein
VETGHAARCYDDARLIRQGEAFPASAAAGHLVLAGGEPVDGEATAEAAEVGRSGDAREGLLGRSGPHGIVREWLAGRGKLARTVR